MTLALILKLVHVLAAIWMTAGIIGRNVTLIAASRAADIHDVTAMMPISGIFERRMVIPGSLAVLLAGILTAAAQRRPIFNHVPGLPTYWVPVSLVLFLAIMPLIIFILAPKGKTFEAALHDAQARDAITPELSAAFRDPAVWMARNLEVILVFVIILLMVLKPF